MHQLILMRHAQAASAVPAGGDRERSLSPRGHAEALAAGRTLAARGIRPDLAIVSAARRTRDTWTGVAEGLGIEADMPGLEVEAALYNAGADVLRRHVQGAEERWETLILIAHNPG